MTTTFPDYISKDLFEKSLRNGFKDSSIVINDYEISMGSSAGDNYCSDIYRAKISYTKSGESNNTISLIIKAMPFVESRSPAMNDLEVFDKEVRMYTDTLPKISDILDGEYVCARFFYAVKEPVQLVVFEDLKVLGFQMADRQAGIDEAHCELVLSKLGRFHAASIVLSEREKHHMDQFYFGLFKPNGKVADLKKAVFEKGLLSCIEQVKTWPGYDTIAEKMDILSENFIQKITKHCNNSPATIKVLNHGDLWVNNFLFKYEEGKPVDVVFVDYQLSYFTSPGLDITYFLSTSPTNEVRENKIDELIETYYNNFSKILKDSSKQQYSLEAVKKEILSREFYGFAASIGITPLIMMDKKASKESSMDTLVDKEASARLRNAMYKSPNYRKAMEFMLKKFDEHNVLENIW